MRKLLVIMATFGAIAWSGAALAVVDESTVTVTNNGKELDGATVSLKTSEGKTATVRPKRPMNPKRPTTARVGKHGKITLVRREKDRQSDQIIVVTVTTKDGVTLPPVYTTANRLMSSATFDMATSGGGPIIAWPGISTTVANNWTGPYVTLFATWNSESANTSEYLLDTDVQTNAIRGSNSAFGGGAGAGYTIPCGLGICGGEIEGDIFGNAFNGQNFGAAKVGIEPHGKVTAELVGGLPWDWMNQANQTIYGLWYGKGGFSEVDVNVYPLSSSADNKWVPAWTVAGGVAVRQDGWPITGFAEVDFTRTANINDQNGAFGYNSRLSLWQIKAGVLVPLGSFIASDIRLKRDIRQVDRLPNGLALYRYCYLWSDTVYVGVMAQEVAQVFPDAVAHGADGYLRVDYVRLGLKLETWDEWKSESQSH